MKTPATLHRERPVQPDRFIRAIDAHAMWTRTHPNAKSTPTRNHVMWLRRPDGQEIGYRLLAGTITTASSLRR